MKEISNNSLALAGEFAVLSQLSLRGYDANLTLGNTKGVDILVSDPRSNLMFRLEVKTNFPSNIKVPQESKLFGKFISSWRMDRKHEENRDQKLFYCFVNINGQTNAFRFFILPSAIVADYVKQQHRLWISDGVSKGRVRQDTDMRQFRIGIGGEKYLISTPTADEYENNWNLTKS